MSLLININLKKATSSEKTYQILCFLGLNNFGIYLRDGPFQSDIGIVNLHPFEGTHWVLYVQKNFLVSYDCPPPQILSKIIIKRNGHCSYSDYKIQGLTDKKEYFCASYCLYRNYLT